MWTAYKGTDIPAGLGRAPVGYKGKWLARNDVGQVMVHPGLGAGRTPAQYGPWSPGRHSSGVSLGAGPSPSDYGAWTPRSGSGYSKKRPLGAAFPNNAIAVAQNTDVSGDLNVRSGPGTGNGAVGGIPHGALFYITGPAVDSTGALWPLTDMADPTTLKSPMTSSNPDNNAWWPAASADFSVQGYVAVGPGTSGEQLVTLTGQTTPIVNPGGGGGGGGGPGPQPPPPQPTPQPGGTTAPSSSNTGMIVGGILGVGALAGLAYWGLKKSRRHAHA